MDNIRDTIAKDASDRLELIAEDTKQEVLPWIRDLMKKQKEVLIKMIDVLVLIYGDDADENEIRDIVVEQFMSTFDVLVNEIKDELNTPD